MLGFFLDHFLQFFYAPHGSPWYVGNVYGNVVAVSILAPAGYVWSRTRFWPLRPIKHGLAALHTKLEEHHTALHQRHDEHAQKLDRLVARVDALHEKHDKLAKKL